MYRELKVAGCLENENDGASKAEPTHILSWRQRLAAEEGRRCGVGGFGIRAWRRTAAANVGAQILYDE